MSLSWLKLATYLIAALVAVPLLQIFLSWFVVDVEFWTHLFQTVLGDLLRNTVVLASGVAVGVTVLGVSLAWFTSMCEFPGRKIFDWSLMLPMALPAYVMAFVFLGIMEYAGPVQTFLRSVFGLGVSFNARSDLAVIWVMSLVLYPYVYMLARAAFLNQGSVLWESSRSLGASAGRSFYRVALPLARPAVVGGASLAVMETLADFGVVSIFNYDTFTTAIYKAWYGFFDLQSAAQLASLLLLFVFFSLFLEKQSRGRRKYYQQKSTENFNPIKLGFFARWAVTLWCGLILSLAFVIPIIQLVIWAVEASHSSIIDSKYFGFLWHSVALATLSAVIVVICALIIAYTKKLYPGKSMQVLTQLSTQGYAIPGSVLAVGIMVSFTTIDGLLGEVYDLLGWSGPVLVSSLLALLMAYAVRFMVIAYTPIESSIQSITPSISEAAQSLGSTPRRILFRIYIPILMPGILTAALLVFVEVLKEMPATLLLRPFGWDTLGVKIYEYTAESEWQLAAIPSLILIVFGLLPVIFIISQTRK